MIYKITFENNSVKHIVADDVDTYGKVLNFYRNNTQPNNLFIGGSGRTTIASFKMKWVTVETVENLPFEEAQAGDTGDTI